MKQSTILHIIATIIFAGSIALIIIWYDWRLLVILMVFVWGNNISLRASRIEERGK